MTPGIEISNKESGKLFAAMLKTLPCQMFIEDHLADNIELCIEFKLDEDHIIEATCVMCRYDWVRLMEQIKPSDTVGDESVEIDWSDMDKSTLIDEMEPYIDELVGKIETFEIKVINLNE
jgi:hypothetical protein